MPKKRVMGKRGQLAPSNTLMFGVILFIISLLFLVAAPWVPSLSRVAPFLILAGIIMVLMDFFRGNREWDLFLALLGLLLFNLTPLVRGATYTLWAAIALNVSVIILMVFPMREHARNIWHRVLLLFSAILLLVQMYFVYLISTGRLIAQ